MSKLLSALRGMRKPEPQKPENVPKTPVPEQPAGKDEPTIDELGRYTYRDYDYYIRSDGTAEIEAYMGPAVGDLALPEELYGVPVTAILDEAFEADETLERITIPNSIVDIGTNPFKNCQQLKEIVVAPNHPCLEVRDGVLFNRRSKRLICYPCALETESYAIPRGTREIGNEAFQECQALKEVSFPASARFIGDQAFIYCESLESVAFEDGLIHIGDRAFLGCVKLAEIRIPDSVTDIGEDAFSYCDSLRTVGLPQGIGRIRPRAFFACKSLQEAVIPGSVTVIGKSAFSACKSLKTVVIPDSVGSIEADAFEDCPQLTAKVRLGSYAAAYCRTHGVLYRC